ncbi:WD40 repeat domain-containing protein [Hoeflea sp. TYP-13]|uniref:WD40 repeat domain-containing protein n=1 Tax=Hoeflea sp. TYP-13 TaxID=3230023 RepID=UPI0034C65D2F
MNFANARPPQLFDLLAREWTLSSPVDGAVFNRGCGTVAASCEDGSIALAETADDDSPTARVRNAIDTGRQTIQRRGGPVPPLLEVKGIKRRTTPVVPLGESNFLFGDSEGNLSALTPQGDLLSSGHAMDKAISAISASPNNASYACAAGNLIQIAQWDLGEPSCEIETKQTINNLAFSPDGQHIAATHDDGVSIWDMSGKLFKSQKKTLNSAPAKVRWSADGKWIAYTFASGGFCLIDLKNNQARNFEDYPTAVKSIAFSKPANIVATSGAYRAVAWSLEHPLTDSDSCAAVTSGKPGFVAVDSIAASPDRDLLAVGYANGLLCLTKIGSQDEMLLRQNDDAGISSLSWSDNGSFLAVGMSNGKFALVEFPIGMFK